MIISSNYAPVCLKDWDRYVRITSAYLESEGSRMANEGLVRLQKLMNAATDHCDHILADELHCYGSLVMQESITEEHRRGERGATTC